MSDTTYVKYHYTPFVILNRKQSASDWGSRDYRLDSRFHGNDKEEMQE